MRTFFFLLAWATVSHWTASSKYTLATRTPSATNPDTIVVSLTDTAYSTGFVKGDSLNMAYAFANYSPSTVASFNYIAGDTLTDSALVYENHKLVAVVSKPVKGNNPIYFTFGNQSVATPENWTFTTRKKKPGSKTATTNKWQFNYFLQ